MAQVRPIPPLRPLIIVPAWNEAPVIQNTLREIHAAVPNTDVVVVDDGSTDNTTSLARAMGAITLELPFNIGVGAAMRTGFLYAKRNGYTAVVQVDADGQHNPAEIPKLLAKLQDGSADIVIGSRFCGNTPYAVSAPRRLAMRMLAHMLTKISHTHLTDITSGFRAANSRALDQYISHYPNEYLGDTVDSLVIASCNGIRIAEVSVQMRQRQGGSPSHSPVRAAIFLLRSLMVVVNGFWAKAEPSHLTPAVGTLREDAGSATLPASTIAAEPLRGK